MEGLIKKNKIMENLHLNAQVALCIMLPLLGIAYFMMIGGAFEKRNKK